MIIEDWLRSRTPAPPAVLLDRIVSHLGEDAHADSTRGSEICAGAGVRVLTQLIGARCGDRQNALDLLAADALVTYAIESASEHAVEPGAEMDALVTRLAGIADQVTS